MKKTNSLIHTYTKVVFAFIILFSAMSVSASSPGGVSAALWFRADNGITTGSNLIWTNQGSLGTTNNATQSTVAKQPELVQTSINFNPVLRFYGNNTLKFNDVGLNNGGSARSFIAVASNSSVDANNRDLFYYGTPASYQKSGLIKGPSNQSVTQGYDADHSLANVWASAGVSHLVYGSYSSSTASGSFDGSPVSSTTVNTWNTVLSGTGYIGSQEDTGEYWNGKIAEIIQFNKQLTTAELNQVNSYLAIKYGISLSQSTPQNYTASNGNTIWDATTNSGYSNNIAGIARDDNSGLNQKQSRSENSGLQVVIGNGTIAENNASNTNYFSSDLSALMWGDNGGSVTSWTATGAPSGLKIINRQWKVQEIGTVGSVKIQVADNSGINGLPNEGSTSVILLVDNDGDFTSGATQYVMTLNGTNWEANVNLTSGQHFTFAICATPVESPVFALGTLSNRCQSAENVLYTATANNSTSISYSLDATSIAAGNSINSSTGRVTYVASWVGTSVITATADGCGGPVTETHTVITNPSVTTPVFDLGSASTRCQGASTITYNATATNASSLTFSLDAASLDAGNTINSATGEVTFSAGWSGTTTVTATAAGCNGPKTASHTVTVNGSLGQPIFNLGVSSTRCKASGNVTYSASASNNTGLTYSLDAVSLSAGNTINSSTGKVTYVSSWVGTSYITVTATGCGGSLTEVHAATTANTLGTPVFSLGSTSSRCQAAGSVTYTASATNSTNITYSLDASSLSAGNTINSSTGEVSYVATWTGTTTVTALASGGCDGPKTATHTVTVNPTIGTPTFSLGENSNRCVGAGSVVYTATSTNSTAITYTLDATSLTEGNTINSSTGKVTYTTNWVGTSYITATASGCGGPLVIVHAATTTPSIETPVFSLGASSSRCQGASTITYSATSANSASITYSLDATSKTAGNTINSSTGAVTYTASWTGTSTIIATATGCNGPKTATHTVTINGTLGTPLFVLGSVSERCGGAGTITYTANATNSTSISYSLDATSTAAGNSINSSNGTVSYVSGWHGVSTITATAMGCNGTTTATHTATTLNIVAVDDAVSLIQGNVAEINVLSNDTYDTEHSTVTIITAPIGGMATVANGVITYYSNGYFVGTDQIVYQVGGCAQATVTINVSEGIGDPCAEATRAKTFYLPFPENDTLKKSLLSAANVNNLSNNIRSVVSIKMPYPGTIITYDQWEDGYEPDITKPVQSTTQIWGDGNLKNGVAPGYSNDIIPPGGYVYIDNQFQYSPRVSTTIAFDGKDKIYSTNDIAVAKVTGDAGASGIGPTFAVQNIKTNVYDTSRFGTYFVIPFGENVTLGSTSAFKYTGVFIRASKNGTTVKMDYNNDGVNEITTNLNEGEVYFYDGTGSTPGADPGDVNNSNDIKAGGTIVSNNPVGVDFIFGGIDNYGTRNLAILPGTFYGDTYYCPVHTTLSSAPVYAFFTTESSTPVTVNWTTGNGASGSLTIPANGNTYLSLSNTAAYKFQSAGGEAFTAVAVMDADASGSMYDWSFNMIQEKRLTNFSSISWAPGSNDNSGNYNPVWVTSPTATTLYIKYDGDLTKVTPTMSPCNMPYDIAVPISALQSYKIYDNKDNNQTGLAVYTCDNSKVVAVWGENPYNQATGVTTPTASPAQDVGFVMEPRCIQYQIIANDDYEVTPPNTPIIVNNIANDYGFLCSVNKSSVATAGLLQPSNGTIVVNSDGTITYTPNSGFLGTDQFEYSVCSNEYPNECDIALVTIKVTECDANASENLITGKVFMEQLPDDGTYDGETGVGGIRVNLYNDVNCNGIVDGSEAITQSTISDLSGNYEFSTQNGYNFKDDFEPTPGFDGNDGGILWSNNWTENGDDNNLTTGNVRIMADGSLGNAIRLSNANKGINRSAVFTGATSAVLRFGVRREGLDNQGEALNVQVNGSTILTINDGDYVGTDLNYYNYELPLSSFNANGTNTIQFITNGSLASDDYFWIDNVELVYFRQPSCYIIKVDPTNTGGSYSSSSLNTQTASFTGLSSCDKNNYLGVLANLTAAPDAAFTAVDIPVNINILKNDVIGNPNATTLSIATEPTHGTVMIKSDGTVTYTPNPAYIGNDTFVYSVCSTDDPAICSTATVTVTVSCTSVVGVNIINGRVYNDINNNGVFDTSDTNRAGVGVKLYYDADADGAIDSGESSAIQTATSSSDGSYVFTIIPPAITKTYLDQFNSNTTSTQSNGTSTWITSWNEIGTTNGFAAAPIRITSANGLSIEGNGNATVLGAYRSANLSNAIAATLTYKFTESGLDLDVDDYVDAYIANSGSPSSWTLLKRYTGADSQNQTGTESFDITPYISATTTIKFVTSGSASLSASNMVNFDNVQISYQTATTSNYIVQLAQPIPSGYQLTSPTPSPVGLYTASFTASGAGSCQNTFGLSGSDLKISKTVQSQTPYVGTYVTFTITATNNGTSNATNVVVNDALPTGYSFVSANPSIGTWSDPNWNVGNLNVGQSAVLTIIAKVNTNGVYTNTSTITGSQPDPDTSNNTSSTTPVPIKSNPIAVNDLNTTYVGQSVGGNVLTNDSDPLGLTLTVTADTKTTTQGGTVTINTDGTYIYTPPANFVGNDTFTYIVCNTLGLCSSATVTITVMEIPGPPNNPPVALNDAYAGSLNTAVNGNVMSNDFDVDGNLDMNSATLVNGGTAVTNGTLTLNSDGTFLFVPNTVFYGQVNFTYKINDKGTPVYYDDAVVTIDIIQTTTNSVIAVNDAEKTLINTPVSGNVLTNDIDPEGNNMTVTSTGTLTTTHGSVVINSNGTYTYTPAYNYYGEDTFTYTVCDDGTPQACDQATVTITVIKPTTNNDPPVAVNDAYTTQINTSITKSVLLNDYDPDNNLNTNSVSLISGGTATTNGTLLLNSNGTFTFTPNAGFTGQVNFTYQVCDTGTPVLCDQATVTIDILPNPPGNVTYATDDSYSGKEDYQITNNVLNNDYDPQGDQQTVNTTPVVLPSHGTVVLQSDGTFTYTPDSKYNGQDQFVYQVCDNGTPVACAKATVYLNIEPVNDPPIAIDDVNTTFINTPVSGQVLTNDSDPENDPLTVTAQTNATTTNGGKVTVNSDGTYIYTPPTGFVGEDIFTYQVCDNSGLCDIAKVTIEVMDIPITQNNPPVAVNDAYSASVNTTVTGDVIANDFDTDGNLNPNGITLLNGGTAATNGTLTLNPNGKFTYVPNTGFVGQVSFTYQVCDTGTPALCDEAVVTIDILPVKVNDTYATDDAFIGKEDNTISGNVLTNDYDPQGNTQTVDTKPLVAPKYGTLVLNSDGTFTYTPATNFNGQDQFVYQVCDNGTPVACDKATVYLNVTPVNDPPVAINDVNTTFIDIPVRGQVLTNDSDPENDPLTVTAQTNTTTTNGGKVTVNSDGTYIYTPPTGFVGEDTFTYQACDPYGACDVATVTIEVMNIPTSQNNPPVAVNDAYTASINTTITGNVIANDFDVDGNLNPNSVVLLSGGTAATNGTLTLNSDGKFTYVPNSGFIGQVSFTYQISDTGTPIYNNDAVVTIDVLPDVYFNSIVAIDDATKTLINTPVSGNVIANDFDPEKNNFAVTSAGTIATAHGSVVLTSDGNYTYTPTTGYVGYDSFTYTICDNGIPQACDDATVSIYVISNPTTENDPPVALNDAYTTSINTPISSTVLPNDYDPDGNLNTTNGVTLISGGTATANGTLTLNPNGTFTFTPNTGFVGKVNFTYQVSDTGSPVYSAQTNVTINVLQNSTNNVTFATDDAFIGIEDNNITGNILANDYDPQGDTQTVNTTPLVAPEHGTVVLHTDGTFTYTPVANFNGPDQFVYEVCDNGTPIACDKATVYLNVASINDPPVAIDDVNTTFINTPVSGQVLTNDSDPENDPLTVTAQTNATTTNGGRVTVNTNGTYTYNPPTGFVGEDTFTYQVCDPNGACDVATVTIEVMNDPNPQNDPPVAVNDAYTASINTTVTGNVIANDFDVDGNLNPNSVVLLNGGTAATNGTLTLNSDGKFTYVPNTGFIGQVSFTYQISDTGIPIYNDDAVVTIDVLPNVFSNKVVAVDDAEKTLVNTPVSGNVLINDFDPEGNTFAVTTTGTITTAHGSVVLNANGTYTYTPATGYVGNDTFNYTICDNGIPQACDDATVNISIISNPTTENDPPVALNDAYTTSINTPISNTVLTNDYDPDNNLNTTNGVTLINGGTATANGTLTLNPNGTFTFTPNTGFVGKVDFTYQICDTGTPILCDEAIVTIDVLQNPSNNATFATDDAYIGSENTNISGSVLDNDYDPQGDKQTVNTTPLVAPQHGTLVLKPDGTFTYTPAANYNGEDQFVYEVCDDGTPVACDKATVYLSIVNNNVSLTLKAMLQGARVDIVDAGVYTNDGLMRDNLRAKGLIPATSPYTTAPAKTITDIANVLSDKGANSIVDWVLVELRSSIDATTVIAQASGLIQRDGDIVDVDGSSPLYISGLNGVKKAYIVVSHRNHLGVMTENPVDLITDATYDFTSQALYKIPTAKEEAAFVYNGEKMLWGGDVNTDGMIKATGANNDATPIYNEIMNNAGNSFLGTSYIIKNVYNALDINMNGEIRFTASGNDQNLININILVNSIGNTYTGIGYALFYDNLP